MNVLAECNRREMSPQSFHREVGGAPLTKVTAAFELLAQYEWLERTRSEEREGGEVEPFYRGTGVPLVDAEAWDAMPDSTRALITGRVFDMLVQRTRRAMKAGTISARSDVHLSWMSLELDRQGWDEIIGRLDAVFAGLGDSEERAQARLAESGEEPIAMTVGLLGFESPRDGPRGS
jgi:hypothetical protein